MRRIGRRRRPREEPPEGRAASTAGASAVTSRGIAGRVALDSPADGYIGTSASSATSPARLLAAAASAG